MDSSAAHDLQQPHYNRALEHRAQLRWLYFLSLGTLWFLRKHAFARVFVTNAALTVERPGGTVEIPFHQVEAVSFFHLPVAGGWFTLTMRDGRMHRFSAFLERSDYVLDALAIAQPTLVPNARLANYRRSAIVADHVLARMERAFADWRWLALMQLGLPLALTAAVSFALSVNDAGAAILIFASLGVLNAIVTLSVWWWLELFEILRKHGELTENPLNPLRDLKREKRARGYARMIHASVFAALSLWMWL
jgi:hypothetical protein